MNWIKLILNVAALFAGLFIYIGMVSSKWGKEHTNLQYFLMLTAVLAAVLIGWLLQVIFRAAGIL